MKNGIERRRHPRVPLALPIVLKTPQGAIEGKTLNISVGGLAVLLFKEKPEMAKSDPDRLFELIDDACYMLNRMQRRREKYNEFREVANSVLDRLNQIEGPKTEDAFQKADELRAFLRENPEKVAEKLHHVNELAEGVRDVANRMEKEVLYAYRDLAIELGEVYEQIKGSRKWKKG